MAIDTIIFYSIINLYNEYYNIIFYRKEVIFFVKNNSVCLFASKEYHLLYWMLQHETDTIYGPMVKFSQIELAKECKSSPATVNKWIASLRKAKCVELTKRGNYCVTGTGRKVITKMEEIEKIIGGKKNAY